MIGVPGSARLPQWSCAWTVTGDSSAGLLKSLETGSPSFAKPGLIGEKSENVSSSGPGTTTTFALPVLVVNTVSFTLSVWPGVGLAVLKATPLRMGNVCVPPSPLWNA